MTHVTSNDSFKILIEYKKMLRQVVSRAATIFAEDNIVGVFI